MKKVNISKGGSASGSADAINATFGGNGSGTPKSKSTPKVTPKKTSVRKRKQASEDDEEDGLKAAATPKAKKMKGGAIKGVKVEEGAEEYVTAESGEVDDEALMGV